MKAEDGVMQLEAKEHRAGHQEPPGAGREARNGLSAEPPEGSNFADTWISDFWPLELRGSESLLFEFTQTVVICYPGKQLVL